MAAQTLTFLTQGDIGGRLPALDQAVRSMVSATFVQGRFRIEMPIVLPSGSVATVTVCTEGSDDSFMVTDDGASLFEIASGAFSETLFTRVAKERCERYGASFDGAAMLYFRVSSGRLRGAIVAMANLMKEVVDETVHRSINQKARQIDHELWDKLERTFVGCEVVRRAHFLGESTADHQFSAILTTDRGLVAFDTFTAQGNSINSVYTKMADIGRNENPPKGIAVTRRMSDIGPKLNLVTSVAQVVEIGIQPQDLHRLALAA
ncbi:MAG: hypothetical protein V4747_12800 [Pseudomonadota bacterium]